ncbi:MAG: hypothetical protein LC808_07875 [Actinobacteria bacterium]|nr:hypothetical protein [Actinomycetota bacterium]
MSDDALADAVARRLAAWPRQRITLLELEELVVSERPELNASVELGPRLAEIVDAVIGDGVVRPAKQRKIYRGIRVPASLFRPATPHTQRERPALRYPWCADLAWASGTEGSTFEQLVLLDRWLTANPNPSPMPVKERSLEIWEDEKLLERLLRGPLRGRTPPGLRLIVVHPPLVVERISDAGGGLLVENATTWWSIVTAGQLHVDAGAPTTLGWVAYGVGNQVGAAVPGLAKRAPTSLWYFGDLDARGLRFAVDAALAATDAGLPAVRPHRWLYESLLTTGRPQRRKMRWTWPESGLAWLGAETGARVEAELTNTWLAQEWVSTLLLRADAGWLMP